MSDTSREAQLKFDLAQLEGQIRWLCQRRDMLQLEYDQLLRVLRERCNDSSVIIPLPEKPTPFETALFALVSDLLTRIRRLESTSRGIL